MTPGRAHASSTGKVLEEMVLPALKCGGYQYKKQVDIGDRLGAGKKHRVDVLAWPDKTPNRCYLISLKWQQVSGTTEQKVPFELISLLHAVLTGGGKYIRAYIVLGGSGWVWRDFYLQGGLKKYVNYKDDQGNIFGYESLVSIVKLEDFVAKANRGKL